MWEKRDVAASGKRTMLRQLSPVYLPVWGLQARSLWISCPLKDALF